MGHDHDMLVAGGGPVGLYAGFLLAEAGLTVRIVDEQAALPLDLRATSFHPPTLDMLAGHGITAELVADGLVCEAWQVRLHPSGERAVFPLAVLKGETDHPFRLQCEQWKLSRALMARLRATPDAEVSLATRLTAFTQDDTGVTAELDGPAGRETCRARLLVGADGIASTVRKILGLPFEGEAFPETTLVVTTPFRFEDHLEGLTPVTSCWTEQGNLAFLRLPGFWRLALYPKPGQTIEERLKPKAIQAALAEIVPGAGPFAIMGAWPYRVQQRIVPTYRVGRVALAGDAAHVNSPAGGMGLNAGLHDAAELAATVAAILKDGADVSLLDRYDRRRRPVMAEEVQKAAAANAARMREKDPDKRRAMLADLQAITRDPVRLKDYVMRASMIEGLRRGAPLQ